MEHTITEKLGTAGLVFALFCGCSASTALIRDPAMLVKDPGSLVGHPKFEKNVARVVAIWESSTGTDVDARNCRGFAGQILFFGPECQTGVRVRGVVNIYEFDHYDQESENNPEPLHTFSFVSDAWEVHRTEGSLGHSYSVFIPYMSQNKDQVNCGLKVEIVLEDGRKVTTPITQVMLHGKNSKAAAISKTRGFVRENQIGQNSDGNPVFDSPHAPKSADRTMDTFRIPLPKR